MTQSTGVAAAPGAVRRRRPAAQRPTPQRRPPHPGRGTRPARRRHRLGAPRPGRHARPDAAGRGARGAGQPGCFGLGGRAGLPRRPPSALRAGRVPTPPRWSGSGRSATNLVRADAAATNAFLVGGPRARRAARRPTTPGHHRQRPSWSPRPRGPSRPTAPRSAALNTAIADLHRRRRAGPGQQPAGAAAWARSTCTRPAPACAPRRCPLLELADSSRQRRPGADRVRRTPGGRWLVARRARAARPRRARRRARSGWPGAPTATSTCRWPARGGRRPGRAGRRLARAAQRSARASSDVRDRSRTPTSWPLSAGAGRGLRRQGQREPDADRARVGRGVREGLADASGQVTERPAGARPSSPGSETAVGRLRQRAPGASAPSTTAAAGTQAVAAATEPRRTAAPTPRSTRSTTASPHAAHRGRGRRHAGCSSPRPTAGSHLAGASRLLVGLLAAASSLVGRLPAAGGVPMSRRLPAALAGAVARPGRRGRLRSGCYAACTGRRRATRPRARPQPRHGHPDPGGDRERRSPRPTALQSYAPPGALPGPDAAGRQRRMAEIQQARPADRRRLGRHPAARRPQPGHRADRGLRHRRAAAGRQGDLRRPRQDRAPGDHRRRSASRCCRTAASTSSPATMTINCDRWTADRVLRRVLPRRPEGARATRVQGHRRWTTSSGQEGLRARPGRPAWTSSRQSRRRHRRPGRHPHRLPGAVPAGPGRRHHR